MHYQHLMTLRTMVPPGIPSTAHSTIFYPFCYHDIRIAPQQFYRNLREKAELPLHSVRLPNTRKYPLLLQYPLMGTLPLPPSSTESCPGSRHLSDPASIHHEKP